MSIRSNTVSSFGMWFPGLDENWYDKKLQQKISSEDSTVKGFNVGTNSGKVAGQSIFHCHIHVIPRREGDVENPQGGVRSVIPSKQHYIRKK